MSSILPNLKITSVLIKPDNTCEIINLKDNNDIFKIIGNDVSFVFNKNNNNNFFCYCNNRERIKENALGYRVLVMLGFEVGDKIYGNIIITGSINDKGNNKPLNNNQINIIRYIINLINNIDRYFNLPL
jgi:hypothetical protein